MQIPESLRAAIEDHTERFAYRDLATAAAALPAAYRNQDARTPRRFSALDAIAYAITRMPATLAAVGSVLRRSGCEGRTLVDIGAGCGATAWAAAARWPDLERVVCVERDPEMASLGRVLARGARFPAPLEWMPSDASSLASFPACDTAIFSYSLREIDESARRPVVEAAWRAARDAVLIVEPGSPSGFAVVRAARAWLLAAGASLAAPCPHIHDCPMPVDDWCHFAARVERTALQRRLKGGELSYEDEKFSYVAARRDPCLNPSATILRRPVQRPGVVQLALCAVDGLAEARIRKRDTLWRDARKAAWGDRWPRAR